jgi:hypothetical protein
MKGLPSRAEGPFLLRNSSPARETGVIAVASGDHSKIKRDENRFREPTAFVPVGEAVGGIDVHPELYPASTPRL